MSGERWAPIPGADGYEASDQGRVRGVDRVLSDGRTWKSRVLKQALTRQGYWVARLGKASKPRMVHHLVLLAFVGPAPGPLGIHDGEWTGDHKNFRRTDNQLSNLEWVTASENRRRALPRRPNGTAINTHKLSSEQVRQLRSAAASGRAVNQLARDYGIAHSSAHAIVNRKSWAWLS